MTTHINGKQAIEMYVNGRSVGEAYSYGHLVFSRAGDGWRQGPSTTMTITSNNGTSVSGTIELLRFDYYQNGAITDRYYQVGSKNISSNEHGVVELNLGTNAAVVYGSLGASWDYPTPSTGVITIAADELRRLFRLRGINRVLDLGSTFNVVSYYLEPVWDMAPTMSGTADIVCATGWSVCHNRTSRISVASSLTTNVSVLSLPAATGTFPIFMVAQSAPETSAVSLTCAQSAHQVYDTQCLRTIGFITVNNSVITSVTPVSDTQYTAGYPVTKSISGAILSIGEGWATDTDGIKVLVPAATYDFSDMVAAAADHTTDWENVPNSYANSGTGYWSSGSSSGTAWATASNLGKYGPCKVRLTATALYPGFSAQDGGQPKIYILQALYTLSSNPQRYLVGVSSGEVKNAIAGEKSITSPEITIPSGEALNSVRGSMQIMNMSVQFPAQWWSSIIAEAQQEVEGTTQTRLVYAQVTRSSTSSGKSCVITPNAGDSSTYTSYIYLGTITVTRNSSTGTIS